MNPRDPQPPHDTKAIRAASDPAHGEPPVHVPPPGAGAMNVVRWVLFALLSVLAVASLASYLVSRREDRSPAAHAAHIVYQCPMHPSYTSDRPGECPICGMTLEPVEATAALRDSATATMGDVPGLAAITLPADRIQMIGLRTVRAERRPVGGRLELAGTVTPDESRLRRVQLRVGGYIQSLYVNRTGELVKAGQPLLAIYSPELYQSEREFLIERESLTPSTGDTMNMSHGESASAARERLRLLGVPDEEIRRLEREGKASTRLTFHSPVTGTVLERNAVEGQSVGADTPLLTVADLGRVWVLADLYEIDYSRVRVGDPARFTADGVGDRRFDGRVEFVYPTVSSDTRTLKVRVSLANPGGILRPGMYGKLAVSGRGGTGLALPSEAVIHTGESDYVFIARAGGRFEPRRVRVGASDDGDWVPVLSGVADGDTVVASASFLIDSESRLKAAIAGSAAGAGAAPSAAGHRHGGTP